MRLSLFDYLHNICLLKAIVDALNAITVICYAKKKM